VPRAGPPNPLTMSTNVVAKAQDIRRVNMIKFSMSAGNAILWRTSYGFIRLRITLTCYTRLRRWGFVEIPS
jgi:hypothetical protein